MIKSSSRGLFLRLLHPAPSAGTIAVEPGALDAAAVMAVEHNLFMLLYGQVRSLRERMAPAGEADAFLERHRRLRDLDQDFYRGPIGTSRSPGSWARERSRPGFGASWPSTVRAASA